MELAVVDGDLDVDDGEAEGAALAHRPLHPLLDGGDELARDRPADHLVDEEEALAPPERLDAQVADAELAVPAGLLLVPSLGLGRLGDRLSVGDEQLLALHVDVELARQALLDDGEVGLA